MKEQAFDPSRWEQVQDNADRIMRGLDPFFGEPNDKANGQARQSPRDQSGVIVRCAFDVEPRPIDWLWAGRIARGKHTAIAGEPGTGKSTLAIQIIAARYNGG